METQLRAIEQCFSREISPRRRELMSAEKHIKDARLHDPKFVTAIIDEADAESLPEIEEKLEQLAKFAYLVVQSLETIEQNLSIVHDNLHYIKEESKRDWRKPKNLERVRIWENSIKELAEPDESDIYGTKTLQHYRDIAAQLMDGRLQNYQAKLLFKKFELNRSDNLHELLDQAIELYQQIGFDLRKQAQSSDGITDPELAQQFQSLDQFLQMTMNAPLITHTLLNDVQARRKVDPYYLPNTLPAFLSKPKIGQDPELFKRQRIAEHLQAWMRGMTLRVNATHATKEWQIKEAIEYFENQNSEWRQLSDEAKEFFEKNILPVYQKAYDEVRQNDLREFKTQDEKIVEFGIKDYVNHIYHYNNEEALKFRKFIHNGRIYQRDFDSDDPLAIKPACTIESSSKAVKGMAAFIVNGRGEFYAGSHLSNYYDGPEQTEYQFHSAYTKGGDVFFAGEKQVDDEGYFTVLTNSSGHYQPTIENFFYFYLFLKDKGVDLSKCTFRLTDFKTNKKVELTEANFFEYYAALKLYQQDYDELKNLIVKGILNKENAANIFMYAANCAAPKEILQFLMEQGFDLNYVDENSFTPLHIAAKHNHWQIVDYLVALGADLTLKNSDGLTGLELANQNGYEPAPEAQNAIDELSPDKDTPYSAISPGRDASTPASVSDTNIHASQDEDEYEDEAEAEAEAEEIYSVISLRRDASTPVGASDTNIHASQSEEEDLAEEAPSEDQEPEYSAISKVASNTAENDSSAANIEEESAGSYGSFDQVRGDESNPDDYNPELIESEAESESVEGHVDLDLDHSSDEEPVTYAGLPNLEVQASAELQERMGGVPAAIATIETELNAVAGDVELLTARLAKSDIATHVKDDAAFASRLQVFIINAVTSYLKQLNENLTILSSDVPEIDPSDTIDSQNYQTKFDNVAVIAERQAKLMAQQRQLTSTIALLNKHIVNPELVQSLHEQLTVRDKLISNRLEDLTANMLGYHQRWQEFRGRNHQLLDDNAQMIQQQAQILDGSKQKLSGISKQSNFNQNAIYGILEITQQKPRLFGLTKQQKKLLTELPGYLLGLEINIQQKLAELSELDKKLAEINEQLVEISDDKLATQYTEQDQLSVLIGLDRDKLQQGFTELYTDVQQKKQKFIKQLENVTEAKAWLYQQTMTRQYIKLAAYHIKEYQAFVNQEQQAIQKCKEIMEQRDDKVAMPRTFIERVQKQLHAVKQQKKQLEELQYTLPEQVTEEFKAKYGLSHAQKEEILAVNKRANELLAIMAKQENYWLELLAGQMSLRAEEQEIMARHARPVPSSNEPQQTWQPSSHTTRPARVRGFLNTRQLNPDTPETRSMERVHDGKNYHSNGLFYTRKTTPCGVELNYTDPTKGRVPIVEAESRKHTYQNQRQLIEKMCLDNYLGVTDLRQKEIVVEGDARLVRETCIVLSAMGMTPYLSDDKKYEPSIEDNVAIQARREQLEERGVLAKAEAESDILEQALSASRYLRPH